MVPFTECHLFPVEHVGRIRHPTPILEISIAKQECSAQLRISLHLHEGCLAPFTSASSTPLCWKYKLEHVFTIFHVVF